MPSSDSEDVFSTPPQPSAIPPRSMANDPILPRIFLRLLLPASIFPLKHLLNPFGPSSLFIPPLILLLDAILQSFSPVLSALFHSSCNPLPPQPIPPNSASPGRRLFAQPSPDSHFAHKKPLPLPSRSNIPRRSLLNGLLIFIHHASFLFAISQLSVLRLVLLTVCAKDWAHSLASLVRLLATKPLASLHLLSSSHLHLPDNNAGAGAVGLCMLLACFTIDLHLNPLHPSDLARLPAGYLAILVHLVALGFQSPDPDPDPRVVEPPRVQRSATLAAAAIALVVGLVCFLFSPATPAYPHQAGPSPYLIPLSLLFATVKYLSTALADLTAARGLSSQSSLLTTVVLTMLGCEIIGTVGFGAPIGNLADRLVAGICYLGIGNMVTSKTHYKLHTPTNSVHQASSHISLFDRLALLGRRTRSTVKTILGNPESRNIYFFLCLNLAYMVVQMMYGIWTNSLGLISDSIHMFFDCMALGMGLFASVMATWPADEQFTYGYGRVETLSGYANGLFLMLISVFIVFEAIQRLVDPPEMNTNQLLVVSFVGLVVNLVGMFCTGHHHHHGHSHGHDHCHSHNMKGVFLHVMADTLGSVGVIISTILIERYGWTGFDPLASIFIAVLIFASVVPLVQDSARVLMLDLGEEREREVRGALAKVSRVEGLSSYSAPRFWPQDSSSLSCSLHIQLTPSPTSVSVGRGGLEEVRYERALKVRDKVEDVLRENVAGLVEVSVQLEGVEGGRRCFCLTGR